MSSFEVAPVLMNEENPGPQLSHQNWNKVQMMFHKLDYQTTDITGITERLHISSLQLVWNHQDVTQDLHPSPTGCYRSNTCVRGAPLPHQAKVGVHRPDRGAVSLSSPADR